MARASAAAENAALTGLATVMLFFALNVSDPGTTGAGENANSGSYARQSVAWNTPSGGTMTNSGAMAFSTGGTVAVPYGSTWSSATYGAGTVAIGVVLASAVTAASITIAAGAVSVACT